MTLRRILANRWLWLVAIPPVCVWLGGVVVCLRGGNWWTAAANLLAVVGYLAIVLIYRFAELHLGDVRREGEGLLRRMDERVAALDFERAQLYHQRQLVEAQARDLARRESWPE